MTQQTPIQKRCRICQTKKLLNEFNIDDDVLDKRQNICKACLITKDLSSDIILNNIVTSAYYMAGLLLELAKGGVELPAALIQRLQATAMLSGARVYCEVCRKKFEKT